MRFSKSSLSNGRLTLVAALLASVLVVVALAMWSLCRSYRAYEELARVSTQNFSELLIHDIGEMVDSADKVLLLVSDEYARQAQSAHPDATAVDGLIQRQLARHPELVAIRLADASGILQHGIEDAPLLSNLHIEDRDYFQRQRDDAHVGLLISGPIQGKISGKWGLMLSRRLSHPDGRFAGVVLVNLSVEKIEALFARLHLGERSWLALRNENLALVARYPVDDSFRKTGDSRVSDDFVDALRQAPASGTYEAGASSLDGVKRLHSYRQHPSYGFYVNVGVAKEDFLAPWWQEVRTTSLIVLLVCAVIVWATWMLRRAWRRQEIFLASLAASEARYRSIIEASPVPYAVNNDRGEITFLNQAFTRAFGYALEDMSCLAQWWPRAYPDPAYREWVLTSWQTRLQRAVAEGAEFEPLEVSMLCADGEFKTVLVSASRLGASYAGQHLVTFFDITERKRAEAEVMNYRAHLEHLVDARTSELAAANRQLLDTQYAMEKVGIGISWINPDTRRFLWANHFSATMLGYTHDEYLGLEISDIDPDFPPASYEQVRQRLKTEGYAQFETQHRAKDGRVFPVEVSVYQHIGREGEPDRLIAFTVDISQRKETELELARAHEAVQAANAAKSAFLSNMSHEMRTPLHQLSALLQLLQRDPLTEKQQRYLAQVDTVERRLGGIVDSLLTLTDLESRKVVLQEVVVDPDKIIRDAVAIHAAEAQAKGLVLSITPGERWESLIGDPVQIEIALLNYLSNALRFTRQGEVTLSAKLMEDRGDHVVVRFEVRDTGPGIAEDVIPRLFSIFEQGDNSASREYSGAGLGLAMTRKLAQLMGGEAGCESVLGVGSNFWFTVLLKR